jgi:hypothetical protein
MDILVQGHTNNKIITSVICSGICVFNNLMLNVLICFDIGVLVDNHLTLNEMKSVTKMNSWTLKITNKQAFTIHEI